MKKIKEIKEKEERDKREFRKRMEYEIHKRGLWKKKEDYEEQRARRYVRYINEMYEICDPEKHLEITEGTKKEGIKHCNTRSIWEKEHEEEENIKNVYEKISIIEEKRTVIPRRKEKVMIVINNKLYIEEIYVEPYEEEFETEVLKRKVWLKKFRPKENEMYETRYGKMNGKDLMLIAIKTGVNIYEEGMIEEF